MSLFSNEIINNAESHVKTEQVKKMPLKLIHRISDDGDDFYFKGPYNIKLDFVGNIYVIDQDEFLKFDASGKFIRNLMKKGIGPGECRNISNYNFSKENGITLYDYYLFKIIKNGPDGKLIDEKRLPTNKFLSLFYQDRDKLFFTYDSLDSNKGKAEIVDIDEQIIEFLPENNSFKNIISFPFKNFAFKTSNTFATVRITPFLSTHYDKNRFFISHTREYGIKLIDLDSAKVLIEFKRSYKKVKVTDENKKYIPYGQFIADGKLVRSPIPDYMNDIQSIHFSNGRLYIFTSTVDKDKGVLVDVFNPNGKYSDCFYLKFQGKNSCYMLYQNLVTIVNDYIYLIEQDESDDWVISKYQLLYENDKTGPVKKGAIVQTK